MIVEIHGLLGEEFEEKIETHFHKENDVVKELCAKVKGFKERVLSLMKEGFNYFISRDGNKFIISPVIFGLGAFDFVTKPFKKAAKWVGKNIGTIAGVALLATGIGGALLGTSVLWGTMSATSAMLIGGALIATSLMSKAPTAPTATNDSSKTSVNSTSNTLSGDQTSAQGQPLPLGFGMMIVAGVTAYSSIDNIRGNVAVKDYLAQGGK